MLGGHSPVFHLFLQRRVQRELRAKKPGCKYLSELVYTSTSSRVVSLIASLSLTAKTWLKPNSNVS